MFIWTICECSADCFHKKRDIFLFITFAFLGSEADVWPIMEVNGALTVSSQNSIYLLRIDWSGSQFSFVLDLISSLYLWSSRVHLWNATRNPFTHDNGLILKQFRNVMTWLRWVLSACLLHSALCSVHSACHIVLHSDMFTVLHTAVTCLSHSVVCCAVLVWCAAVLCCCAGVLCILIGGQRNKDLSPLLLVFYILQLHLMQSTLFPLTNNNYQRVQILSDSLHIFFLSKGCLKYSYSIFWRAGSLKSVLVSILDPDQTKLTKTLNSSKIAYPSFHPPIKTTTMTRTISSSESAHLAWRLPFTPLTNNTFIPWKQFSCIASNTLQCFIFLLLPICLTNIFWPDSTVRELVGFVEQMQQMQI